MGQILHIFRKDVRHHWPEILLCQAALAAYCWNEVRSWSERPRFSFSFNTLSTAIGVLLPLTWGFFVFRLVQSESLVGDRQFWITRPYEWKKLLAAKILLVLAVISLPLLMAGAWLLARAGFSPAPHLVGLLWMQLLLLQFPLLPLLAFAAVTRNLAQGLLALLAVLLFIAGNVAFEELLRDTGMSFDIDDWLLSAIVVIVCLAALGLQYGRRNTKASRLWLASGALVMALFPLANGYVNRGKDLYPLPSGGPSFQAGLQTVALSAPKEAPEKNEAVSIGVPVQAWGLPPDSLARVRGVRLALQAPDGFHWDSGWQGYSTLLGPKENQWRQDFTMSYKEYERLRSVPLKAHVAIALEVLRERDFASTSVASSEFNVPRVGRCRVWENDLATLRCHAPLLKPSMVVMRVDLAASTCPIRDEDENKRRDGIVSSWESPSDAWLAEYGVSPVSSFWFYFSEARICPGTVIDLSFPEWVKNTRSDFEIDNLNLNDYRLPKFGFSAVYGVGIVRRK